MYVRRIESIAPERWRNGGGVTREIASDGQRWRASIAEVERDGPYSRFEGLTRISYVLRGAGVVLRNHDAKLTLAPFQAVEYEGGRLWQASLIDGPMSVLNVMYISDEYSVHVQALTSDIVVLPGCGALVVALDTACHCDEAGVVAAGNALVIDHVRRPLQLSPMSHSNVPPALVTIEPI
ncbi:HutD/Ves family protein [Paraburkholderia phenoliruptrix]|uniref:HutD/Ves family protein n=1 Tax=Paraburkholderia phenoliruptrix TaxID=252970 RepID=UPI0028698893|nr:HutD family protein [Paraburkholderia phenoliruptrix]WMY10883.1 HutD family protein [Paraburkholderia phenoliruptrix]